MQTWAIVIWTVLGCTATVIFIQIYAYFEDPQRRKNNEDWFDAFEENVQQRYREGGIAWRAADLSMHFGKADTDARTLDAWFKSKLSMFKK